MKTVKEALAFDVNVGLPGKAVIYDGVVMNAFGVNEIFVIGDAFKATEILQTEVLRLSKLAGELL